MQALWILWLLAETQVAPAPPQILQVTPPGGRRGTTVEVAVKGSNLEPVAAVLFDDPRVTARVVAIERTGRARDERKAGASAGDRVAQRIDTFQVKLQIQIGSEAKPGVRSFRLRTPRGTTNRGMFAVGDLAEVRAAAASSVEKPQVVELPATLGGALDTADDQDYFAFSVRAGETLVFDVHATQLGSTLDPVLALLDDTGKVVAHTDNQPRQGDPVLIHRTTKSGRYVLAVSDAEHGGGPAHVYRIAAGALPYVTGVRPLGARRGALQRFSLAGHNLGSVRHARLSAPADGPRAEIVPLAVVVDGRPALGRLKVAADPHRVASEREPNNTRPAAQALAIPSTIEGRIGASADEDLFRFQARKGGKLVFSVMADRLGSALDAELAVLDAHGQEVPRAVLRPTAQTTVTLRNHAGTRPGIRFDSTAGFGAGDLVLIGLEVMRIADVQEQPDFDVQMAALRGHRRPLFDTTAQGHPLGAPIYRVEAHPPGATFAPNGMPTFTLTHKNDDGGPGYGRDARVRFEAPRDGVYFVRLRDKLGTHGADCFYRLTAAPPAPDFALTIGPADPHVPRGGAVPVTVTATRFDDFSGAIDIELFDLPPGFSSSPGRIPAGGDEVALVLAAAPDAADPAPLPLKVRGRSIVNDRAIVREGTADDPLGLIALREPAEVRVAAAWPPEIELEPGARTTITVRIERAGGARMRLPLRLLNLPSGVKVPDVGLNGILINEDEDRREIAVTALPNAVPGRHTIVPLARVETRGRDLEYVGPTVRLVVLPRRMAAAD